MANAKKAAHSARTIAERTTYPSAQAGSPVQPPASGPEKVTRVDQLQASTTRARVAERANSVIDAVGGVRALADLMEVSPSQPSRWRRGQEAPSPRYSRELVDLDYVFARAALIWDASVITSWFTGGNAFLDGARPIDVLRSRGPVEVIAALDAEASGTFA